MATGEEPNQGPTSRTCFSAGFTDLNGKSLQTSVEEEEEEGGVGVSGGNMGRLRGDERETRLVDEEGTFDDVPEGRRHLQLETSSLERKQPLNGLQKEVMIANSLARQLA